MTTQEPPEGSVDPPLDPKLVETAHACFDYARDGATERLSAHIGQGVPANLADATGNTLLMLTAYHGHAETVAALVALGADPNRTNDRGQSPLAGAVFKGEKDVVQALLTAGADPDLGSPSARETAKMFDRADLLPQTP